MSRKRKNYASGRRELASMRLKDLKRACVVRGMPFDEVLEADMPTLASWYNQHNDRSQDLKFLDMYDDHVEALLQARGHKTTDPMLSPYFRLGFIGERDDEGKAVTKKRVRSIGVESKKKKKKTRDSFGLYTGTKKSLTFELTKAGEKIDNILTRVMEQFPDAKEKSIRIWNKRALREIK